MSILSTYSHSDAVLVIPSKLGSSDHLPENMEGDDVAIFPNLNTTGSLLRIVVREDGIAIADIVEPGKAWTAFPVADAARDE